MTHLETHTLLAHADGELTDAEELAVTRHLAHCAECSRALSALHEAGALFSSALHARDAAEPAHWNESLPTVPRREPARVVPLRGMGAATHDSPGSRAARRAPRGHGYVRWAAGIVLVTASAASALVLRTVWTDEREPAIADSAPAARPAPAPEEAAVIVQPREGTLRVVLSNVATGSRVRVTSEDRADASIAVSGPAAPHFTAEDGRVAVDARGHVSQFHLVLPRVLRDATVTLDGETLVTVRDGQVRPAHAATTGISVDAASTSRME